MGEQVRPITQQTNTAPPPCSWVLWDVIRIGVIRTPMFLQIQVAMGGSVSAWV